MKIELNDSDKRSIRRCIKEVVDILQNTFALEYTYQEAVKALLYVKQEIDTLEADISITLNLLEGRIQ